MTISLIRRLSFTVSRFKSLYLNFRKKILRGAYIDTTRNHIQAYRCYAGDVVPISPVAGMGTALNSGLFQQVGLVEVSGITFDLKEEGVYRFFQLPTISEQRIVCSGGIESLLKMIGYLWAYGNVDERIRVSELENALVNRCVVATCGKLSAIAKRIFYMYGISSRMVAMVTCDKWGGQDDGHTLVEVKINKNKWILYDPSYNCCFRFNGERLSLMEFTNVVKSGEYCIEKLPGNIGHSVFKTDSYDYGFWADQRMLSESMLRKWYKKICDIPLIRDKDTYYFPLGYVPEIDLDRISSRYRPIEDSSFFRTFYANSD